MLFERIKLENDEKMLRVVRKHWWIIFTRTTSAVVAVVTPGVGFIAVEIATPNYSLSAIAAPYLPEIVFVYLAWVLMNWMMIANFWMDHYLDLWAITNRRIVAIEQNGFFRRMLSSFRLERLQDMNIEVNGIIPTLLNFGSIEAQTAGGSNEEFKTDNMPDPRGLKALIILAADKRQKEAIDRNPLNTDGTL